MLLSMKLVFFEKSSLVQKIKVVYFYEVHVVHIKKTGLKPAISMVTIPLQTKSAHWAISMCI